MKFVIVLKPDMGGKQPVRAENMEPWIYIILVRVKIPVSLFQAPHSCYGWIDVPDLMVSGDFLSETLGTLFNVRVRDGGKIYYFHGEVYFFVADKKGENGCFSAD